MTTGVRQEPAAQRRRQPNPLLVKELRGRMRRFRSFAVLAGYLMILGCLVVSVYYLYVAQSDASGMGADMTDLGQALFFLIVVAEIYMIMSIPPAFTAGAISGERERKTYELLRTTLLSARQLVLGKLYSALGFIVLLILAALPLEMLAFTIGGVTLGELLISQLLLLVTALTLSSAGMAVSAFFRTTLVSNATVYALSVLVGVVFPVFVLIVGGIVDAINVYHPHWLWQAALVYVGLIGLSLSPISAAVASEMMLHDKGSLVLGWEPVDGHFIPLPSAWILFTVIYLGLSSLLLLLAIWRVRQPERK